MATLINEERAREIADDYGKKIYEIYEKYLSEAITQIEIEVKEYIEDTLGLDFDVYGNCLNDIDYNIEEGEISEDIYYGLTEGDSTVYEVVKD